MVLDYTPSQFNETKMPVPVWDCSELVLEEPLDSVLSNDIWKKFDLDEPLDVSYVQSYHGVSSIEDQRAMMMSSNSSSSGHSYSSSVNSGSDDDYTYCGSSIQLPEYRDKFSCGDSREIRHHDCMWAGLCISKEHNRTLPAKKDSQIHSRKVPAGRSLLISSRAPSAASTIPPTTTQQQQHHQTSTNLQMIHQHQMQSHKKMRKDSLESDGDSARPETPQSSEESETESEDDDEEIDTKHIVNNSCNSQRRILRPHEIKREPVIDGPLVFRHDQISINEKLSECMSTDNTTHKAAPVSEVTGQLVRNCQYQTTIDRIKVEDDYHHGNGINYPNQQQKNTIVVKKEPDNWNTLSDHCYHQPSSKKLDHLGVQTPSDSEEEIDVVTFEKPCRPAVLPTFPSIEDQQHLQLTVNTALTEKPVTAPRPRGRPPSNGTPKKRAASSQLEPKKPAKRTRHRSYQKQSKVTKNGPPTPAASPLKATTINTTTMSTASMSGTASTSRSSSSSDDEPDTEKRSLHNNMERQRRIELRNAFEELRVLVPEVEAKEKAPKVAILRQAAVYCDMLTEIGQVSVTRVIEMKRRQERLRARLSQLRRTLASTR